MDRNFINVIIPMTVSGCIRMGLFKLTKRRESPSGTGSDVSTISESTVSEAVEKKNDGISIKDQRTTRISILIGDERQTDITGVTVGAGTVTDNTEGSDVFAQDVITVKPIPSGETEEHAAENQEGPVITMEPVVENKEPVKEAEPVAENVQPIVEKKEPVVEKAEPIAEKKEPVVENKEPVKESATNTAKTDSKKSSKVGTIYGNVGTSNFDCRVCAHLERSEYVMVNHEDYGYVLCQVGNLIRKSNLSLEKSLNVPEGTEIRDVITAHIDVIGYRDERGLLLTPRTTFKAGSDVVRADPAFIKKVLGLEVNPKTDGYIGILHGHNIPIALNINELIQRHACILAKTGGGKSYMSGDIIEELMKHNVTCMIIDPHGEYGAMRDPGKAGDPRFRVKPRGYKNRIREFAVSNDNKDKNIKPLKFSFRTLDAKEILELFRTKDTRTHLPPLKKALEKVRENQQFYSVRDLINVLNEDQENKNPILVSELEYIDDMGVFSAKGNAIDELIEDGKTTIINLKGVSPDIQQMIVKRLSTVAFEMRKKNLIPPLMMVVEEAHNYCPQGTALLSSKPLATIASEGRKFGLGLMVISQRPAKIDKNVLSQCGTQIILKVTNPNDVKAISQSIEGLTNGMTDDIQTMPIGMAMVVGAGIESPLLVEVRPRESRHGGAGVKILEESD